MAPTVTATHHINIYAQTQQQNRTDNNRHMCRHNLKQNRFKPKAQWKQKLAKQLYAKRVEMHTAN